MRLSSVVLPAPGEDMTLTDHTPWPARSALVGRGDAVVLGEDRLEHRDARHAGVGVPAVVADVAVVVIVSWSWSCVVLGAVGVAVEAAHQRTSSATSIEASSSSSPLAQLDVVALARARRPAPASRASCRRRTPRQCTTAGHVLDDELAAGQVGRLGEHLPREQQRVGHDLAEVADAHVRPGAPAGSPARASTCSRIAWQIESSCTRYADARPSVTAASRWRRPKL